MSTEAQRAAITSNGNTVVRAGAGSGKTHVLVERYVELLHRGYSPLQVIVTTYTERAALELRARIRTRVHDAFGGRAELLAEFEAAQIGTVHALAARICRDHPGPAGLHAGSRIRDDVEARDQHEAWLIEALNQEDPSIFERFDYSRLRRMLALLLEEPYVTERAFERTSHDWRDVIEEARARAWDAVVATEEWMATVQQISADQGHEDDAIEKTRRKAVDGLQAIAEGRWLDGVTCLKALTFRGGKKTGWRDLDRTKGALKALRQLVEDDPLLSVEWGEGDEALQQALPSLHGAYVRAYDVFQARKRRTLSHDYADLEIHALAALTQPEVSHHYARRWKHVLVDEFQDTSPVQAEILTQLAAFCDLFIVGDDQQAIYGFRGAAHEVLDEFEQLLGKRSVTPVTLTSSFRTGPALLHRLNDAAAAVLGRAARPLTAHRSENTAFPEPVTGRIVPPGTEADAIADAVSDLLTSAPLIEDPRTGQQRALQAGDVAVLARSWKALSSVQTSLNGKGISWTMGGGGNLLDTPEVRDAWALLRFLAHSGDNVALLSVLRSPHFSLTDPQLERLRQDRNGAEAWWLTCQRSQAPEVVEAVRVLTALLEIRRKYPPRRLLVEMERSSGYREALKMLPDAEQHLADLAACHDLITNLEGGLQDCADVVIKLTRLIAAAHPVLRPSLVSNSSVYLSTIHGAKGLEWPVVVLMDINGAVRDQAPAVHLAADLGVAFAVDGVPSGLHTLIKATTRQRDQEEEARLIYVGMTRARDHLICTSSRGTAPMVQALERAGVFHRSDRL